LLAFVDEAFALLGVLNECVGISNCFTSLMLVVAFWQSQLGNAEGDVSNLVFSTTLHEVLNQLTKLANGFFGVGGLCRLKKLRAKCC